jgi:hypothetical protein
VNVRIGPCRNNSLREYGMIEPEGARNACGGAEASLPGSSFATMPAPMADAEVETMNSRRFSVRGLDIGSEPLT